MQNLKTIICLTIIFFTINTFSQHIHHELNVELSIKGKSITVTDDVTIPKEIINNNNVFPFLLNKNLTPVSMDKSIVINKVQGENVDANYYKYEVEFTNSSTEALLFPIKYSGVIAEEITTGANEYARGFSDTDGIISEDGVFLAGSTYWIPSFEESLLTFNLTVNLRSDWNVVSQGERIINEAVGMTRKVKYHSKNPTEEVYLISAAWTEYERKDEDVLFQAFLRTPDSALASRYINATSDYLDMYVDLVGPYPYSKFALVENFWETGFGMPSFTLLGEKIIRFPWILYTSYPHELLHNWWGNSVYVDFEKGNWCEGLTAYMADHLLKEQAGQGADYRRTTLQKFTDYVDSENDFPVIEFRSRNNAAEEAIGYGKCLMFNHMLRKEIGDENFIKAYQSFYKDNIYEIATFEDIQKSFQDLSEEDFGPMFDQWLLRKGAPNIQLEEVKMEKSAKGFELHFKLMQVQEEEPFYVKVPVAIYFKDRVELLEVLSASRNTEYSFQYNTQPVKIEVDPQFDVFRRLDKAEVPPSLSQIFGSSKGMIILPAGSPFLEAYQMLATTWKETQEAQGKSIKIILDEELDQIPDNLSTWIIGFDNKFAKIFNVQENYQSVFSTEQNDLINILTSEGSLVYAIPNPVNNNFTTGFIGTNVNQAIPGLTRLLTHYGKYSFLGFEGERPNNVLKGNFPALNSPLKYNIPYDGIVWETNGVLAPAKALIE